MFEPSICLNIEAMKCGRNAVENSGLLGLLPIMQHFNLGIVIFLFFPFYQIEIGAIVLLIHLDNEVLLQVNKAGFFKRKSPSVPMQVPSLIFQVLFNSPGLTV